MKNQVRIVSFLTLLSACAFGNVFAQKRTTADDVNSMNLESVFPVTENQPLGLLGGAQQIQIKNVHLADTTSAIDKITVSFFQGTGCTLPTGSQRIITTGSSLSFTTSQTRGLNQQAAFAIAQAVGASSVSSIKLYVEDTVNNRQFLTSAGSTMPCFEGIVCASNICTTTTDPIDVTY